MLIDKLERANNALINMAQMAMTDKEQVATLTLKVAGFTRQCGSMEAKLDRILEGQTWVGGKRKYPHT